MIGLYGYLQDGYWTFQRGKHIDEGWWIQIQDKEFVVFEIPQNGGNPMEIRRCKTFDEAHTIAVSLT